MHHARKSSRDFFKFEILHRSKKSNARVGVITTPHGQIQTPCFVPVGTNAAMKCVSHNEVEGMELMFANTYHLLLQPGPEVIRNAGGLHTFMNRQKPIITDSGGFQVFSLQHGSIVDERSGSGGGELKRAVLNKRNNNASGTVLKIDEQGVTFRSYRDGKKIFLSPENSVDAQKAFGADIIIPLDELPPHHIDERSLINSLSRTHRWEERSLHQHLKNVNQQAMYGVIHGSTSVRLREISADHIRKLDFDGLCIGGSLGRTKEDLDSILQAVMPRLQSEEVPRPIHLLGIGDAPSIIAGIKQGVDQFDSSLPTKVARHGTVFLRNGERFNIRAGKHANDMSPLDEQCTCAVCRQHSRAYLHHLWKAKEPVVMNLLSQHNLCFTLSLMEAQRDAILKGDV